MVNLSTRDGPSFPPTPPNPGKTLLPAVLGVSDAATADLVVVLVVVPEIAPAPMLPLPPKHI